MKSSSKDRQETTGKREGAIEKESTISSGTYGLTSKQKFFTEQSRGGHSKLKSSLNLPGEASNFNNELTDTQTQFNNKTRHNRFFSNQQKTPSSFCLDTKSAAQDKDSMEKESTTYYESLENATWTDLDLLNGADAKNQDIVGTIQEQFRKVISEMNSKYNIKSIKKKKEPKEQDEIMKYMSEDDMAQLEQEDLEPEVREKILERIEQKRRKAYDRQK